MAQKKRAPQTGAKKRKKPDTAAKRAAEQEPVRLPVRQMLAGACLLLAVLALFACLGAQGFLLSGVKNLLCGLLGSLGFYLSPLLFGLLFVLLVWDRVGRLVCAVCRLCCSWCWHLPSCICS